MVGGDYFDVSSALGQSSEQVGEMSGTMEECSMTIQNARHCEVGTVLSQRGTLQLVWYSIIHRYAPT